MNPEIEQNGNHPSGNEVTDSVKSTKSVKLRVTDIEWLQDSADEGESPAAVLSRFREEFSSLRARCNGYESEVLALRAENDVLQDGLDRFGRLGSRTALTTPAGQSSFNDFGGAAVKDTMDAIKDVCDDETVCVKTALHMIDTKAAVMSKQLDRDHATEQKRLDREDKEKDRKLKQDLADKRAQHEKEMSMIKKGIVKEEDLEGVVFLGSMQKRQTAGEMLAERKKRAYHAANTDEDGGDFDGELIDDGESEYGGDGE